MNRATKSGTGKALMPRFSIGNPYFVMLVCLALLVSGVKSIFIVPAAYLLVYGRPKPHTAETSSMEPAQ